MDLLKIIYISGAMFQRRIQYGNKMFTLSV